MNTASSEYTKSFEYGIIGVLLSSASSVYDVTGTLTTQLVKDSLINKLTLNIDSAPSSLSNLKPKGGIWLTGNAGNYQRFEYNGITDNGDDTYTFYLSALTTVKATIAEDTKAYVELTDLRILESGDEVESEDYDFIQVKAEKPAQEFPGILGTASNYWKIELMVVYTNRIAQDKQRVKLTSVASVVELAVIKNVTKATLSTYSGLQIEGILQQESDDGKWDSERQSIMGGLEVKFYYQ